MTGDLELSEGPSGLSAGPFPMQQAATIAPGANQDVIFTLDAELPNGPWEAHLRLKTGLIEREASATITFPDAGQGETVTPRARPLFLWIALGVGAAILLIAAALLWWLRRRSVVKNSSN